MIKWLPQSKNKVVFGVCLNLCCQEFEATKCLCVMKKSDCPQTSKDAVQRIYAKYEHRICSTYQLFVFKQNFFICKFLLTVSIILQFFVFKQMNYEHIFTPFLLKYTVLCAVYIIIIILDGLLATNHFLCISYKLLYKTINPL